MLSHKIAMKFRELQKLQLSDRNRQSYGLRIIHSLQTTQNIAVQHFYYTSGRPWV
jgi:hypothetical protein